MITGIKEIIKRTRNKKPGLPRKQGTVNGEYFESCPLEKREWLQLNIKDLNCFVTTACQKYNCNIYHLHPSFRPKDCLNKYGSL